MHQHGSSFFVALALSTLTACSTDPAETPPEEVASLAGEWRMLVFSDTESITHTRGQDPGIEGRTELAEVAPGTWALNVELVKLEGGIPSGSVDALSFEMLEDGDHLIIEDSGEGWAFRYSLEGDELTFTLDPDHPKTTSGDAPSLMAFERTTPLRDRLVGEYDIATVVEDGQTTQAGECIVLDGDPAAMRSTFTFDVSPRLVVHGVEEVISYDDDACTQERSRETSEMDGLLTDDGATVDLYAIPEQDDRGDHHRFDVTEGEGGRLTLDQTDCASSCEGPTQIVLVPRK